MSGLPYLQTMLSPAASPGNPYAAFGALLPALAAKQQTSKAASTLARKSHPQTLNQPPRSKVGVTSQQLQQPPPGTPGPGMMFAGQPPPAQLPPLGAVASPPPPGGQPSPPPTPGGLPGTIDALTQQAAALQKREEAARQQMQSAMAVPQPEAPTYTAPQMQQANPSMALGAALAALFAPKYAQGAMGALGVDQANREKAYDQATEAAKTKWTADLGVYEQKAKNRQEAIENAERLDVATDRSLGQINTQIGTDIYREGQQDIADKRLAETITKDRATEADREVKRREFMMNYQQRERFHNDVVDEFGQKLGLDREKVDAVRGGLILRTRQFEWNMKKFGLSQAETARLAGMRIGAQLIMQLDRDKQNEHRDAFRAVLSGQHDLNTLTMNLMTHLNTMTPEQAQAAVRQLTNYTQTPKGQAFNAGLKAFGVSGEMATNLLDRQSGTDAVTPPEQGAAGAEGAPSGTTINNYYGGQPQGAETGTGASMTPQQMMDFIKNSGSQVAAGVGGGQGAGTPSPAPPDPIEQQYHEYLPQLLPLWKERLDHYHGDVNMAWKDISRTTATLPPRLTNMLRRELLRHARGGSNQGNAVAPPRGNPSPEQALLTGISPALLPR